MEHTHSVRRIYCVCRFRCKSEGSPLLFGGCRRGRDSSASQCMYYVGGSGWENILALNWWFTWLLAVLYLHYTSKYYSHGRNCSAVFKCP